MGEGKSGVGEDQGPPGISQTQGPDDHVQGAHRGDGRKHGGGKDKPQDEGLISHPQLGQAERAQGTEQQGKDRGQGSDRGAVQDHLQERLFREQGKIMDGRRPFGKKGGKLG